MPVASTPRVSAGQPPSGSGGPSAIAAALGVREAAGQPVLDRVREHLKDKRLLLVVDNFEHLLAASPVIRQLIARVPRSEGSGDQPHTVGPVRRARVPGSAFACTRS
ncbi:MAG TPA: hypothetical protein VI756_32295, partial [Blastocatellia bacterium]